MLGRFRRINNTSKQNISYTPIHNSNWVKGEVDGREYQAKLYDEGSMFGIDGGRISKLWVDGLCHYDRGWDDEPREEHQETFNKLVDFLENRPKRSWLK
ncbi:hypothetical protein [Alkalihalobacillus sp. BA299]|uniref:DUF7678 domain-containing protein n=1 Tax=Alkalihalobacillus sp. BA299 TaxID=2815938 RepID=UPI001ADAF234|nr:hypothetical protein [Alkalihalobacillus sp. BA299]